MQLYVDLEFSYKFDPDKIANTCLIDIDIFDNIKRTIIYPQLFPRTTSEKNYNFESWDEVKKRVVEVEIKEKQ